MQHIFAGGEKIFVKPPPGYGLAVNYVWITSLAQKPCPMCGRKPVAYDAGFKFKVVSFVMRL